MPRQIHVHAKFVLNVHVELNKFVSNVHVELNENKIQIDASVCCINDSINSCSNEYRNICVGLTGPETREVS